MPQQYVVNGSRYQARVGFSDPDCDEPSFVTVDIGEEWPIPSYVEHVTISLLDAACREILREIARNYRVNDGNEGDRPSSIIITEEGSVREGQKNEQDTDGHWMWKSSSDGINHRPRKFFIANASDKKIKVEEAGNRDKFAFVEHGETAILEYSRARIIFGVGNREKVIFQGPVTARTSFIVCSGNEFRKTGKLYREDIEELKWIVDGRSYKVVSTSERLQAFMSKRGNMAVDVMNATVSILCNLYEKLMLRSGLSTAAISSG